MPDPDPTQLLQAAAQAAENAHAPYSNYKVGAALLTADGTIIQGCNVENASYGLTLCAERNAFTTAVAAGHRDFSAMAIVVSSNRKSLPFPCGACRQVMAEFCGPELKVIAARIGDFESAEQMALGDLLPKAFRLKKP